LAAEGPKKPKQLSSRDRSSSDTTGQKKKKKKDYSTLKSESILKGVESFDFSSSKGNSSKTGVNEGDIDEVMQERGAQALVSSLLQIANSTKNLQNSQVMERLQMLSQMQQQSRRHLDSSNKEDMNTTKEEEEEEKKKFTKPKTAKRVGSDESTKKKTRDTSPRRHTVFPKSPSRDGTDEAERKEPRKKKSTRGSSPRRESSPFRMQQGGDESNNGMDSSTKSSSSSSGACRSTELHKKNRGSSPRRESAPIRKTNTKEEINGMDVSTKSSSSSTIRRCTSTTKKSSSQQLRRCSSTGGLTRRSGHGKKIMDGSTRKGEAKCSLDASTQSSSSKRRSGDGKKTLDGSSRHQTGSAKDSARSDDKNGMDSSSRKSNRRRPTSSADKNNMDSSMRSSSHAKKSLDGSRRRQTKDAEKSMDGSRRRQTETKGMDSSAPASSTRRSRAKTGTENMEGTRQKRRSTSLGAVSKLSQAKVMLYKKNSDHGPTFSKLTKEPTTPTSVFKNLRRSQVDLYADPTKQRSSEPTTTVASAAAAATAACFGDNKPSGKPRRVTMMPTKAFDLHVSEKSKARRRREGSVMERRMRGKDIKEQKQQRKCRTVQPSLEEGEEEEDAPLGDASCHSNASTVLSKLSPRRRRGREPVTPGRGRHRRMSLSLEPPATRYPESALLPGLLPLRRQSSLSSFAADDFSTGPDDSNDSGKEKTNNNGDSEQATGKRMTSTCLKERLKQLATFSNSTPSAYTEMDDSSVAQSCGPSVVVPFAQQIPKDILKVQRQKKKEMYGAFANSFTDFEFDGGFADLYDDDSSDFGFHGLNVGGDRRESSSPFS